MRNAQTETPKHALEFKTFDGNEGRYMVFRMPNGAFHTLLEVEAKEAARDCGAEEGHNTQTMWESIWNKNSD